MFALFEQFGDWFSFENTARANIFRRDAPRAGDAAAFERLMRYNNFTEDPLSRQGCSGNPPSSAENAISARDDLNPAGGVYPFAALGHRDHAAIDGKYTSYAMMRAGGGRSPWGDEWALQARIVGGPTWDSQPPFVWSSSAYSQLPHLGQPDAWAFNWTTAVFPLQ